MKKPIGPMLSRTAHRSHPMAGAGGVCWLECGARSIEALISEVSALVSGLQGQMTVLEREPNYVVVKAQVSPSAIDQLKGALALAGASFTPPEPGAPSDGVLIFILSSERPVRGADNSGEGEP